MTGEVTDSNPDHYFGAQPAVAIVKKTNETNNDVEPGPHVLTGSPVVWTYEEPALDFSDRVDGFRGRTDGMVGAFSTPIVIRTGDRDELVMSFPKYVRALDPETGRELWRCDGLNPLVYTSPLWDGEVLVAMGGFFGNSLAVKPGGRGDVTSTHKAWSFDLGPDVPSPVSDGKLVYVVRDNGVVHALDVKTGAVVWGPERLKTGAYSSSPVLVDGKIYVTSENEGLTSVFAAGPKFQILAENALDDYALASPAVSNGQIFIRTDKFLWAIGKPASATLD